jgi:hypothetical protein
LRTVVEGHAAAMTRFNILGRIINRLRELGHARSSPHPQQDSLIDAGQRGKPVHGPDSRGKR